MKRTIILALALLIFTSGCAQYALWKRDIKNGREQRTYNKAVASQAGNDQLLGTWSRSEEVVLGKKIFNKRVTQYTLTLFRDASYVYLIDSREPYIRTVRTSNGTWQKIKPGEVVLYREDAEDDAAPHPIRLSDWNNIFVNYSAQLHAPDLPASP